jgi:hypothetical protein
MPAKNCRYIDKSYAFSVQTPENALRIILVIQFGVWHLHGIIKGE